MKYSPSVNALLASLWWAVCVLVGEKEGYFFFLVENVEPGALVLEVRGRLAV
jgi:hypothetical protein